MNSQQNLDTGSLEAGLSQLDNESVDFDQIHLSSEHYENVNRHNSCKKQNELSFSRQGKKKHMKNAGRGRGSCSSKINYRNNDNMLHQIMIDVDDGDMEKCNSQGQGNYRHPNSNLKHQENSNTTNSDQKVTRTNTTDGFSNKANKQEYHTANRINEVHGSMSAAEFYGQNEDT